MDLLSSQTVKIFNVDTDEAWKMTCEGHVIVSFTLFARLPQYAACVTNVATAVMCDLKVFAKGAVILPQIKRYLTSSPMVWIFRVDANQR